MSVRFVGSTLLILATLMAEYDCHLNIVNNRWGDIIWWRKAPSPASYQAFPHRLPALFSYRCWLARCISLVTVPAKLRVTLASVASQCTSQWMQRRRAVKLHPFQVDDLWLNNGAVVSLDKARFVRIAPPSHFTWKLAFGKVLLCTLAGLSVPGPVSSQEDSMYKLAVSSWL